MQLRGFEEARVDDEFVVLGEDGTGEIKTVEGGKDVHVVAFLESLLRFDIKIRHRDERIDDPAHLAVAHAFGELDV